MASMTLPLPDNLYRQVQFLAQAENMSLREYMVYMVTQHVTQQEFIVATEADLRQQKQQFDELLSRLGPPATDEEFDAFFETTDWLGTDKNTLDPQVMAALDTKIKNAREARRA